MNSTEKVNREDNKEPPMNITVINGSPSGARGTSHTYIRFLEMQFPEHSFQVIEVARKIRKIEQDEKRFEAIVEQMIEADAIIWCYPVYFMLVPAQLKRFMELLFERCRPSVLAGKAATVISSSAHFYDHTAHDYVRGVSADLGMSFVQGFSGGMEDLQSERGRRDVVGFARSFFRHADGQAPVDSADAPLRRTSPAYEPEPVAEVPPTGEGRVVVITDADPGDRNLQNMIDVFQRSVSHPVDVLDINELRMDGGCLDCMGCGDDGVCGYKDEYAAAFDARVAPADVVIYAGAVRDRFFSARMKMFIDRYFRNGHRPVAKRQLVGYLVSGPLGQLPTMNEVLEANMQMGHGQRLGTVTDESMDPESTTARLQSMALTVDEWLEEPWFLPATFLGVGGIKIFRDLVYENKGVLSADHRYYRDNGLYDFPQYNLKKRLIMAVMLLLKRIPFMKKAVKKMIRKGHARQNQVLLTTPVRVQKEAV